MQKFKIRNKIRINNIYIFEKGNALKWTAEVLTVSQIKILNQRSTCSKIIRINLYLVAFMNKNLENLRIQMSI